MYFDQLLGAAHTQKLVETFFSPVFNLFCLKKWFDQLSGARSIGKLVEIHINHVLPILEYNVLIKNMWET